MDNLWLLTEERPKPSVILQIVKAYCEDFHDKLLDGNNVRIRPVIKNDSARCDQTVIKGGIFQFVYEVEGLKVAGADRIYIKIVSGSSSFLDFLLFKQHDVPKEGNLADSPIMAIEETKTGYDESRNTSVYQRGSKFVYISAFYSDINLYMLYNDEHQVSEEKDPPKTFVFGTKMLRTLGVKIIGKNLSDSEFRRFQSLDDLIAFKAKMPPPPGKNNIPIAITKYDDRIEISGRLSKPVECHNIGHDPNIGALSLISKCIRALGWGKDKDIVITEHGVSQEYVNRTSGANKFLYICSMLGVRLDGITMPSRTILPDLYWHYEKSSEKVASILLHVQCMYHGMHCVYENHAGCERGYFRTKNDESFALPKIDSLEEKLNIPDVVLYDFQSNTVVVVEGKKLSTLKKGIEQLNGYDSFENEYIKKSYQNTRIIRCLSIFGGDEQTLPHPEVLIYVNKDGQIFLNTSAPDCIKNAFSSCTDRISKTNDGVFERIVACTPQELAELVRDFGKAGPVAIWPEYRFISSVNCSISALSMTSGKRTVLVRFSDEPMSADDRSISAGGIKFREMLEILRPLIESPIILKAGQDLKILINVFFNAGLKPDGFMYDIRLMAHVLKPSREMVDLLEEFLDGSILWIKTRKEAVRKLAGQTVDEKNEFLLSASELALCLSEKLKSEIDAESWTKNSYYEIEQPLIGVLSIVERTGSHVSTEILDREFNAAISHGEFLSWWTIALSKLKGSVDQNTGRTHDTVFEQMSPCIGSLYLSNPDLRVISEESDKGSLLRSAFTASDGCDIIFCRYSQIELRLLAALARNDELLNAFTTGAGIYTYPMAEIFGKQDSDITQDERREADILNYGIMNGWDASCIGRSLGIDSKFAANRIALFLGKLPYVRPYISSLIDEAHRTGYVETVTGRHIFLRGIQGTGFALIRAENNVSNAYLHGSVADLIKLAMVKVAKFIEGKPVRLTLQIRNGLVLESRHDFTEQAAAKVADIMIKVLNKIVKHSIPLQISTGIGPDLENALRASMPSFGHAA